jgi:parallel beta-helix repeat protein
LLKDGKGYEEAHWLVPLHEFGAFITMSKAITAFFLIWISIWFPSTASSYTLKADTTWSGEVNLTEDILVPEGVVLTILPGTKIVVTPAGSTKTDPEYLSSMTEITIRGVLRSEGTEDSPIAFFSSENAGAWAGIFVDGGTAYLSSCIIRDADTGVYLLTGNLHIKNSIFKQNHYGIVSQGKDSVLHIGSSRIEENDYGILEFNGAKVRLENTVIKGNRKKDRHSFTVKQKVFFRKEFKAQKKGPLKIYRDEVLMGDTVWQGRIEIAGIVRVPENSRLIILPGTVVEFRKKDSDGNGIGENGLMIQGVIIAKGTADDPILFRSAERLRRMGDWDSINIMNSDGVRNLIEYCQIEDAYRGLHFHFSNVELRNSVLRNNYRGMQFQESAVTIKGVHINGNKSGLQARDSDLLLSDSFIVGNYSGIYIFRISSTVRGNTIMDNLREGLRIREGIPVVEQNLFNSNRQGLQVSDSVYGRFSRNVFSHNLENGLSLKGADNIEIYGNFIQKNGLNGITVQESRADIRANHISENGDRGIGVQTFEGIITENDIAHNGSYAIGLEGEKNVAAPSNWWGGDLAEDVIFDINDDPRRGRVDFRNARENPTGYSWPLRHIVSDTTWYGDLYIRNTVDIFSGATLKIFPGSKVVFSEGAGLKIKGSIFAEGRKDARILFTSMKKIGASDWDEILLDHAGVSIFSNCDIEYAGWGIHSHFTTLTVDGCTFRNNFGGFRFMSGPVMIKNSTFSGNAIGIRSYRGTAVIEENLIRGNETGIFVREKGSGLNLRRNNILRNSGYNVRLGDFNSEDVQAAENWWGEGDPSDMIFDEKDEPGIGRVIFEPYADQPFLLEARGIRE